MSKPLKNSDRARGNETVPPEFTDEGDFAYGKQYPINAVHRTVFGSVDRPTNYRLFARFNVQILLRVEGPLSVRRLERSIENTFKKNVSLCSSFSKFDDDFFVEFREPKIDLITLEHIFEPDDPDFTEVIEKCRSRKFNLLGGALFACTLHKFSEDRHVIQLVFNHLIVDGKSTGVIRKTLLEEYSKTEQDDVEIDHSYPAYLKWEASELGKASFAKAASEWKEQLKLADPASLPFEGVRRDDDDPRQTTNKKTIWIPELTDFNSLKRVALRLRVTPAVVILGAFLVLSVRKANGSIASIAEASIIEEGRWFKSLSDTCGWFAQAMPLAIPTDSGVSVASFLKELQATVVSNRTRPLEQGNTQQLFPQGHYGVLGNKRIGFNLLPNMGPGIESGGVVFERMTPPTNPEVSFGLVLSLRTRPTGFEIEWWVNTKVFSMNVVMDISSNLDRVLSTLCSNPEATLAELLG